MGNIMSEIFPKPPPPEPQLQPIPIPIPVDDNPYNYPRQTNNQQKYISYYPYVAKKNCIHVKQNIPFSRTFRSKSF